MNDGPARLVARALAAGAVLAGALAGCHQMTPQEQAQQMIHGCANEAAEYLDPHWTAQQVTGVYPADDGTVDVVLASQGLQVTVSCGVDAGYYTHVLGETVKIEGVDPAPGQLYLPTQHRWLSDAELHARLTGLLAPRPGEYAGVAWAPNSPAVYDVSDLAGVPSTSCFILQSKLEPARQLVACQNKAGHSFWISQGPMTFELGAPPANLPPIPPAPPAELATQPGGAPQ